MPKCVSLFGLRSSTTSIPTSINMGLLSYVALKAPLQNVLPECLLSYLRTLFHFRSFFAYLCFLGLFKSIALKVPPQGSSVLPESFLFR